MKSLEGPEKNGNQRENGSREIFVKSSDPHWDLDLNRAIDEAKEGDTIFVDTERIRRAAIESAKMRKKPNVQFEVIRPSGDL